MVEAAPAAAGGGGGAAEEKKEEAKPEEEEEEEDDVSLQPFLFAYLARPFTAAMAAQHSLGIAAPLPRASGNDEALQEHHSLMLFTLSSLQKLQEVVSMHEAMKKARSFTMCAASFMHSIQCSSSHWGMLWADQ
jgi:hypothetical protein